MKKVLNVTLIAMLLVTGLFAFTGCNNNKEEGGKDSTPTVKEDVSAIDNNDNYFVTIKGKKFKAGDKISSLKELGLKQKDSVLEEKVKKNTYMIGAGAILNEDNKRVINLTPFNPSDDTITVAEAVIGGCEVGEYEYSKISQEVLDLNVEVAGGIKLGSTLADVEKVFGKTDTTYYAESLGYTKYTYKSKKVYRSYEFTIDKNGKVSKIYWQNLVFND